MIVEKIANDYDIHCGSGNHGDHLHGRPEVNTLKVCLNYATITRLNRRKKFLHLRRSVKVVLNFFYNVL